MSHGIAKSQAQLSDSACKKQKYVKYPPMWLAKISCSETLSGSFYHSLIHCAPKEWTIVAARCPMKTLSEEGKKTRGEESRGTVSKGLRGSMAWQLEAEMLWSQAAEVQISALAKQSWGPLSEVEEGECRDPSDEVEGGC